MPTIAMGVWKEDGTMTKAEQKVVDEALSLPLEARVAVVEKLLSSLNAPTQKEIDDAWAEEAERRVAQIDSGEVELVPGEEVFARVRAERAKSKPPIRAIRLDDE